MASLRTEHLSLRYGSVEAFKHISVEVESGQFVAIVGPSGCGKTSFLNTLAGLISPEAASIEGRVFLDETERLKLTDWHGRLGYVFQQDALLPWRTVLRNVEIGLEVKGVPSAQRQARAQELIKLVGLEGFEQFFPYKLSGGMRRRVSLIRTLAYEPEIVFMDEPFGGLDAHTRMILQREVTEIWQRSQRTVVFVTHDLAEAIVMAQRVLVFSHRPARILGDYQVAFPYPRDPIILQTMDEFAQLHLQIWRTLAHEFRAEEELDVRTGQSARAQA